MAETEGSVGDITDRSSRIHREIVQLALLTAVAAGAFFLTRTIASANRATALVDAAAWYRRGQEDYRRGDLEGAIEAFRRAAARNHEEKLYGLALARVLMARDQEPAARRVLLALREGAPEDPEINAALGRLAAARREVDQAIRYYHSALYTPRRSEEPESRTTLRFELVRMLLANDQPARALSELLALSAELDDDGPARLEVGQLFARAGDDRRALQEFQRVLQHDPGDPAALAGAGMAAFRGGDLVRARKYLASAPAGLDQVAETRQVVEAVLVRDPLASRIRSREREARLRANLAYAEGRLTACLAGAAAPHAPEGRALEETLRSFMGQLKPPAAREQDTIESGVELAQRLAGYLVRNCPPTTPVDRALVMIGMQHQDGTR